MVYKNLFIVDLIYMQSIKQLRDYPSSMGCIICLYTCLYDRFEAFRDETSICGLYMPGRPKTFYFTF